MKVIPFLEVIRVLQMICSYLATKFRDQYDNDIGEENIDKTAIKTNSCTERIKLGHKRQFHVYVGIHLVLNKMKEKNKIK